MNALVVERYLGLSITDNVIETAPIILMKLLEYMIRSPEYCKLRQSFHPHVHT